MISAPDARRSGRRPSRCRCSSRRRRDTKPSTPRLAREVGRVLERVERRLDARAVVDDDLDALGPDRARDAVGVPGPRRPGRCTSSARVTPSRLSSQPASADGAGAELDRRRLQGEDRLVLTHSAGRYRPAAVSFVQRDQPPGVPPLQLTGERTLPDVPEENYWYRRHLVVYEWIARARARAARRRPRVRRGLRLRRAGAHARPPSSASTPNPEAFEHARLRVPAANVTLRARHDRALAGDVRLRRVPADDRARPGPRRGARAHPRQLGPGGVAYVSTPNVLTLAPEGAERSGNPWHVREYRAGGVPRAVRARTSRASTCSGSSTRASCARTSGAIERAGWDARARGARLHEAVLRPLHAGDLGARLRAARGPLERSLDLVAVLR